MFAIGSLMRGVEIAIVSDEDALNRHYTFTFTIVQIFITFSIIYLSLESKCVPAAWCQVSMIAEPAEEIYLCWNDFFMDHTPYIHTRDIYKMTSHMTNTRQGISKTHLTSLQSYRLSILR